MRIVIFLLSLPLFHGIDVIRHEGSHALGIILSGGKVTKFIFLPTMLNERFVWGYVSFEGIVSLYAEYAPYIANLFSVILGIILLRRIIERAKSNRISLLVLIVFTALIAFPILNTTYNYVGGLRGHGDFISVFEAYGFWNITLIVVAFIVSSLLYAVKFTRQNKLLFRHAFFGQKD